MKKTLLLCLTLAFNYMFAYSQSIPNIDDCNNNLPFYGWDPLGPLTLNSTIGNIGRLTSIEVDLQDVQDPNDDIVYAGSESGGLWKKTIGTNNWVNLTDGLGIPGLGIQDIAINPENGNEIFCATGVGKVSGSTGYGVGIIHSIDAGQTWERIITTNSGYNHLSFAVEYTPYPPYTLYAGVGNYLYKYVGVNSFGIPVFTSTSVSTQREVIRNIKFTNAITVNNVTTPKSIYISTAIVNTWDNNEARCLIKELGAQNQPIGNWVSVSLPKPNSTDRILRVSLDVADESPDPSNLNRQIVMISYGTSSNEVFVLKRIVGYSNFQTIFTSNTETYLTTLSRNRNDIQISHNNSNIYYSASVELLKSIDDGVYNFLDWQTLPNIHHDIRDILIVTRNGNEELWVAHDGGLHRSINGNTWIKESINMQIAECYDVGIAENHRRIIAGGIDNGNFLYNGNEWTVDPGGDGGPTLFIKGDDQYGVYRLNDQVYLKPPTGTRIKIFQDGTPNLYLETPIVQNPINDDKVLFGDKILREYNFQEHNYQNLLGWGTAGVGVDFYSLGIIKDLSTEAIFGTENITGISMSSSSENVIYVTKHTLGSSTKGLLKTVNNGSTWSDLSNIVIDSKNVLADGFFTDVICNPDDDSEVYVSVSGIKPNSSKVIKSTNGGSTWSDFSTDLPNTIINELSILDISPNKILFAATDFGVYYRVLDGTSTWECFNSGLTAIVKNFEIKYCSRELYVATYGHGIYKTSLSKLYPITFINSSTPIVWNIDQTLYNDIHISNGTKLTIDNSTISMAGNARIIVEAGGELVISNSTITSACDAFWGGIEVQSTNFITQYCSPGSTCDVGKVTFSNSTIERSHFGVRNWNVEGIGSWAGIIKATNTHFLNNRKAVQFKNFENHVPGTNIVINNYSNFRECTFEIDANYMFEVEAPQNAMVSLWEVRGIGFQGCAFLNTSGQVVNTLGINAVSASFQVKDYCPGIYGSCTPVHSSFSGLQIGIANHGVGSKHSFLVDHANFTDNEYGVVCSASNKDVITRNTFSPYIDAATNYDLLYLFPTAIFMQSADGYTIEENNITGIQPGVAIPGQPPVFSYSKGIVASRSGNGSNKIYKNTFGFLDQANVAYDLNHDPITPKKGLQYECNSMSNSINRDITIYGPNAGIATAQGAANDAADNTFTPGISMLEGHIYNHSNQSQSLNYYFHTNQAGYNFKPTSISSNVITTQANGNYSETVDCKTHLNKFDQALPGKLDGLDLDGLWIKASDGVSDYNQAKYLYTALIDGGDTYGLLNTVQNSNAQTAWEIRTELIISSPISIEVIHETIDEEFLSNALLHDVLMVNPHGVRDESVMYKLENKTTPMPAYMINTLLGIYEAQTQKDVLEAEMANELQNANEAARFLTLHWSTDSLNPLNDSILALNDTLNSPAADWTGVAHHIANGNYTAAQSLISNMPVKFNLNDYEADEHTELDGYYSNYITMVTAGNNSFENPTSGQLATLQQLATDSTTKAGRMAQNLILFSEGKIFWPNLPSEPQNKKEGTDPRAKRIETIVPVATVYPNPANQYVTIEFTNIDANAPLQIKVINSVGIEVLSHRETLQNGGLINLVTQSLASGQYFVLIYQNGILLQKQAIEVIH